METPNTVEILLVEDSKYDIDLTLRALNKNHLANKVHVVKDGEEALDYLFAKGQYAEMHTNHRPKVILLDIKLPKIDGLEVLRIIKSDERTKQIPVVILTSSHEEKDLIESYRLGVNSYIVKPIDFNQFMESVSELGFYWLLINKSVD